MTAPRFPRLSVPDPDASAPDRATTAGLLRTARLARGRKRGAVLEQLLAALPGHRLARRQLIEHLLVDRRHPEAAEQLLNEGLLLHPTDCGLTRLRAMFLLLRGEPRAAEREIRPVLARRPHHVGSLLLAARIAQERKALPQAVALLERAAAERPRRDDVKRRLAETLLDAGNRRRARAVLATMGRPAPVLEARMLEAEHRGPEAIALLEAAHRRRPEASETTLALIDLVERHGHPDRLRALARTVGPDQPAALVRAGQAALLLGEFEAVLARLATLRRAGPRRPEALAISAVAAAMLARSGLAHRLLEELRGAPGAPDAAYMSDLWRRALTSRLHDGAVTARTVGVEQNESLLEVMLHRALEVLDEAPQAGAVPATAGRDAGHHRAVCLAALGRVREAHTVLRRADERGEASPAPAAAAPAPASPTRQAA